MYYPSLEDFRKKAQHGNLIPVYKSILADMETPVSAFYKIDGDEYAFLLESVEAEKISLDTRFLAAIRQFYFRARAIGFKLMTCEQGVQSNWKARTR